MIYLDYPVIDIYPTREFDDGEVVDNFVEVIESKAGVFSLGWLSPLHPWSRSTSLFAVGRGEIVVAENMVDSLLGSYAPFWIPTWTSDFSLIENFSAGALTIEVSDAGADLVREHLAIITPSAMEIVRVFDKTDNGDGTTTLTLHDPTTLAGVVGQTLISFACLARLATDEVSFEFPAMDVMQVSLSWTETIGLPYGVGAVAVPGDTIAFDEPTVHSDAFIFEDFGATYADYATWKASLAARYDSWSADDSKASFDSARTFGGNDSLKITDGGGANLFKTISPTKRRVWMRSMVWIDETFPAGDDCYLGALILPEGAVDFPGTVLYLNDNWETGLPGILTYAYADFTPFAIGTVLFDDIKGRWASVIQLAELGGASSRFRTWLDGVEIIDSTWAVQDMTSTDFDVAQLAFGTASPGNICNYGLVEYVDADVNPDPYGLLV